MPVNDQVVVRTVFVRANAGLHQRRVFHRRKPESEVIAHKHESVATHRSFPRSGIELWSSGIIGNLESATVASRNAIDKAVAMIGPDRQLRLREAIISGGRAEEKYILLGGANAVADRLREKFAQPCAARENILVSHQL